MIKNLLSLMMKVGHIIMQLKDWVLIFYIETLNDYNSPSEKLRCILMTHA